VIVDFLYFLQVYGLVILISIASTACGILICEWLITNFSSQNKALKISSGFLVGISFLLITTHIISLLIANAKVAFLAILILVFGLAIFRIAKFLRSESTKIIFIEIRNCGVIFFILLLFVTFIDLLWIQHHSLYGSLGSLHSGRYANISLDIISSNQIAKIPQNIGESMLAVFAMLLGFNSPYLLMFLWLIISVVVSLVFYFGLFRQFDLSNKFSIFGTALVSAGNMGLSIQYVLLLCSGSPLLITGYSDTAIGISSLIFYCFNASFSENRNWKFLLVTLLFVLSWNIFAPQNIFLILSVVLALILLKTLPRKVGDIFSVFKEVSYFKLSVVVVIVAIGVLYGYSFIGMLIGNKNLANHISGIEIFDEKIILSMSYSYRYLPEWKGASANFLTALGILFFSWFGIFIYWKKKFFSQMPLELKNKELSDLIFSFSVIFVAGFLAEFLFIIGDKWNMTRFSYVGNMMGVVVLVLVINSLKNKRIFYSVLTMFFMLPGVGLFIYSKLLDFVFLAPDFSDKFYTMLYLADIVR
jgi:hypothetical protein